MTAFGIAPAITAENRRFWEGAARGELVVEHCGGCRRHVFPPRGYCPECGQRDLDDVVVAGPGVIYSFTVNANSWQPGMDEPFALVLVEFPEAPGFRLLGRTRRVGLDDLRVGQAVSIGFVEGPGGRPVPCFGPVAVGP
jgi:uncharacterized OB-fold protein